MFALGLYTYYRKNAYLSIDIEQFILPSSHSHPAIPRQIPSDGAGGFGLPAGECEGDYQVVVVA